MSIRKSYMTLCMHDNAEVTYKRRDYDGVIEVAFEVADYKGFKTAVFDESLNLVSNNRFNRAELDYFKYFLSNNISVIKRRADRDD